MWQPIKTAPKDGTAVLLCLWGSEYPAREPTHPEMIVASYDEATPDFPWLTLDGANGYHADAPTHWMPLPDPPTT